MVEKTVKRGKARKSKEKPGEARESQGKPGKARKSQKRPEHQCFIFRNAFQIHLNLYPVQTRLLK